MNQPFDPNKEGQDADNMIKQLQQEAKGEQPADSVDTAAETASEPLDTEVVDVEALDPPADAPGDDQGALDAQPVDDSDTDTDTQLASMQSELAASEARWKTLQGMLNKKETEHAEQMNAMRDMLASLAKQAPADTPADTPAPVQEVTPDLITTDDVNEYGKEMLDVMQRSGVVAAQTVLKDALAPLMERIGGIEKQLSGVQHTTEVTAQSSFDRAMNDAVPDWKQLDTDPDFLAWLDVEDEFAGAKRLDMLRQAYKASDAARVSKFFNAYKATLDSGAKPAPQVANADPAPAAAVKPSGKDKLVTPGRTRTTTAPTTEKRIWTPADIDALYDAHMNKEISEKEFLAQERDLFAAQVDGRYHPGRQAA